MSTSSMHYTMHRVVRAINVELKDEFLKFPSDESLRQNAADNLAKYKLPDFAYAIGKDFNCLHNIHCQDTTVAYSSTSYILRKVTEYCTETTCLTLVMYKN